MRYITGNELMTLFRQGIPIVVEVSPEIVMYEGISYENSLCMYNEFFPNMRATVVNVKQTRLDSEILTVSLDVSNWTEYNKTFDIPIHYERDHQNIYWHEMSSYPNNGIVETFVDSGDNIYSFTIVEVNKKIQELYSDFNSSGYDNYIKWLEEQVLELREQADHLAVQ